VAVPYQFEKPRQAVIELVVAERAVLNERIWEPVWEPGELACA
jgi:hypothetical protein